MSPSIPPITAEVPAQVAGAASPLDDDPLCVGCGYNLRGIASDKCPECGLSVDRNQSAISQIPWVHRRATGYFRAYWRTVLLATLHPKRLAAEIARPVPYADARRFRLITVLLTAVPILAVWGWAAIRFDGKNIFSSGMLWGNAGFNSGNSLPWPGWADLLLPYDAGITFTPVLPLGIVLSLLLISGVSSYWFHPASLPIVRQNRAVALSSYACAPILLIWPFVVSMAMSIALDESRVGSRGVSGPVAVTLFVTAGLSELFLPVLFWRSTMSLLRNTTRASVGRLVLASVLIPVTWILSVAIAFGLLPFVIGYFTLVIGSFG